MDRRLFLSLWDVYTKERTHIKWLPSKVPGVVGNGSLGCDKGENGEGRPHFTAGTLL